jgi:hypothetical protein
VKYQKLIYCRHTIKCPIFCSEKRIENELSSLSLGAAEKKKKIALLELSVSPSNGKE